MITLGIETSGHSGSVAIGIDQKIKAEIDLSATGRRHARNLVPEVKALLTDCGMTPADVNVLAVSVGPGSFTGLRVGLTFAKIFAWTTGCQLVAVDTFAAVAAASDQTTPVWVIDDALRGDVFAGKYVLKDDIWTADIAPHLLSFEEWRKTLDENAFISGPGLKKFGPDLHMFEIADLEVQQPQARNVVLIGEQHATNSQFADVWTVEPFYMRRSAAEEKADGPDRATPVSLDD